MNHGVLFQKLIQKVNKMTRTPSRKLTSIDRKQLCKITEGRFQILNEELSSRRQAIRSAISKQVLEEHKTNIAETRKKLENWQKEEKKVAEKVEQLQHDHDAKRTAIIEEAKSKGLTVGRPTYGTTIEDIKPANLDKTVTDRMDKILEDYNAAKINLRTLELETLEKISIAGLETEEAQDFLTEIPELDKLLPPVTEIPELLTKN